MKSNKIKNKKIIIVGVVLLIPALVISILIFPLYYSTIHPERLYVDYGITYLSGNTLRFRCALGLDSANALKSYSYSIEDNRLYITVKGGLVTRGYSCTIVVLIDDDRISEVTEVYAKGGGAAKLLLSIDDGVVVNETLNPDFDPDYTAAEALPHKNMIE